MSETTPKPEFHLNTFVWVNEKKLPGFGKLLDAWLNGHRKFCEGVRPEFSWEWDYKERSQIGFLSQAAILSGGIALEEWVTKKATLDSKEFQGRNDLWLRLSPPTNEKDYFVESKNSYIDLSWDLTKSSLEISQTLDSSCKSALELLQKNEKILALSSFVLRFEGENLQSLDKKTAEVISHIWNQNQQQNHLDAIAVIWIGAEDFQLCREERERNKSGWKSKEFGVILLASRIKTL